MPIIRIDPPPRGNSSFAGFVASVGSMVAAPGKFFAGKAAETATGKKNLFFLPIELDTETGLVKLQAYDRPLMPAARVLAKAMLRDAAPIESMLSQVWSTGVIPPGLPKAYSQAAQIILGEAARQPAKDTTMPGPYMPPGGFAGFAQMTPASKIALTQGVRRASGSKNRKKRKKTKANRPKGAKRTRKMKTKKARLVKGSAAAKRYMASIRKKRK